MMVTGAVRDLAERYTAAWCNRNASSVAGFYSPEGSLSINRGAPAVGRAAIAAAAQEFMTDFPDLAVFMEALEAQADRIVYRWRLTGTNTGPSGTGRRVGIRGFEQWRIGPDGLIAESRGQFDRADFQRQLGHGASGEAG